MKNCLFAIVCILFAAGVAFGQQDFKIKPNYDVIKDSIQSESSEFYYTKLMEKYLKGDISMTLQEKHFLYYGYVYHENYFPYEIITSAIVEEIREKFKSDTLTQESYDEILGLTIEILEINPFHTIALNYQRYLYDYLRKETERDIARRKSEIIFDAIYSTGDGLSEETAFHVILVLHDYYMISALGYEFGDSQQLVNKCDYMTLKENDERLEGLYFDVSACFDFMQGKFKIE